MTMKRLLLPLLLALPLVSCIEEDKPGTDPGTPETPVTPETPTPPSDWQDVGASAGSLKRDAITMTFPAGTFNENEKVGITVAEAGTVAGDTERSPFYQVTMPANGSSKPVMVSIKYDGNLSEVKAAIRTEYFAFSLQEFWTETRIIESSAADGAIHITIPESYPCEGRTPHFSIGLVVADEFAPFTGTRATAEDFTFGWNVSSADKDLYRSNRGKMEEFIRNWVPTAQSMLYARGFDIPKIYYELKNLDGKDGGKNGVVRGLFCPPAFFKTSGYVCINSAQLYKALTTGSSTDVEAMKTTLIHETLHASHCIMYDPRWSIAGNAANFFKGTEWTMLSEALAVWSEQFIREEKVMKGDPVDESENYQPFIKSFFPDGYWYALVTQGRYTNHGYAMAAFIQYLDKKTSHNSIVRLLELQKAGYSSVRAVFDKFLEEKGLTFFDPQSYLDFAFQYCNGDLVSSISYQKINPTKACSTSNTVSVPYDLTGKDVDNYGFVTGSLRYAAPLMRDYSDYNLVFTQLTEGLESHVWYPVSGNRMAYLGKATREEPLTASIAEILKYAEQTQFMTITIKSSMADENSPLSSYLNVAFAMPAKMPDIWSIDFSGDIMVGKKTYWLNLGWTMFETGGSGTQITVSEGGNGYHVEGYDPDYKTRISFGIEAGENGFGDAVQLSCYMPSYDGVTFTIDRMPLIYYDSGKDSSWGSAQWEHKDASDNSIVLKIYYNPL